MTLKWPSLESRDPLLSDEQVRPISWKGCKIGPSVYRWLIGNVTHRKTPFQLTLTDVKIISYIANLFICSFSNNNMQYLIIAAGARSVCNYVSANYSYTVSLLYFAWVVFMVLPRETGVNLFTLTSLRLSRTFITKRLLLNVFIYFSTFITAMADF